MEFRSYRGELDLDKEEGETYRNICFILEQNWKRVEMFDKYFSYRSNHHRSVYNHLGYNLARVNRNG